MNKYLIPIYDIEDDELWIEVINAGSIKDCQEKLIQILIEEYDINEGSNYRDFLINASKANLRIGTITDIETL